MLVYIPIETQAAPFLSSEIYNLTHPKRDSNDVTTFLARWIPNVNDPSMSVLVLEDTYEVPISPDATADVLAVLLKQFVDLGKITQEELDKIGTDVRSNKGKTYRIYDLVPDSWKSRVMDKETAEAMGFIYADPSKEKSIEEVVVK